MSTADFTGLPESVREFQPGCPGCSPGTVSAEGARPCSHYDCPGLPVELQVTCNKCMYDFAASDGQPMCDHTTCEDAIRLTGTVETYRQWVARLAAGAGGSGS